jgi:hypothetical protein
LVDYARKKVDVASSVFDNALKEIFVSGCTEELLYVIELDLNEFGFFV